METVVLGRFRTTRRGTPVTRDVVAAAGFCAVVGVGLWSVVRTHAEPRASRPPMPVHFVIILAAGLGLLAGFAQRELWPFATWKLMADISTADVRVRALVCADSAGNSFAVDHRAWAPLTEEELFSWSWNRLTLLDTAKQSVVAVALVAQVESARQRARLGLDPAARPSILGPIAAPSHLLHPRLWTGPHDTPVTSCVALRLVERRWNVDSAAAGRGSVVVATVWELPAPR